MARARYQQLPSPSVTPTVRTGSPAEARKASISATVAARFAAGHLRPSVLSLLAPGGEPPPPPPCLLGTASPGPSTTLQALVTRQPLLQPLGSATSTSSLNTTSTSPGTTAGSWRGCTSSGGWTICPSTWCSTSSPSLSTCLSELVAEETV